MCLHRALIILSARGHPGSNSVTANACTLTNQKKIKTIIIITTIIIIVNTQFLTPNLNYYPIF